MPIFRNPALDEDPNQPPVDTTTTGSIGGAVRPRPVATTPAAAVRAGAPVQRGGGGGGLLSLIGLGDNQGGQSSSLADRLGFSGGYDDDFRSRLNKLGAVMMMMDPMSRDAGTALLGIEQNRAANRQSLAMANQTVQWLVNTQHMDPNEAMMLARDPAALREWYKTQTAAKMPKWEVHEMYNAKGQKTQVRVDVNSGKYQVMGGSEAPTLTYGTAYDDQGREIHVLINPHDASAPPIQIGGAKTDLLSPGAVEQKKEIAIAGRPTTINQQEGAEAKGTGELYSKAFGDYRKANETASGMLGNLDLMEHIVRSPGFDSGILGPFKLGIQKLAQGAGYTGDEIKGLGDRELFRAVSSKLTLDALGGTLGAGISNTDRDTISSTVPGLSTTKEGNLAIIELHRKMQTRAKEVWQRALQYRATHGRLDEGFDQELEQWREANPILSSAEIERITKLGSAPPEPDTGTSTGQPHIGGGTGATGGGKTKKYSHGGQATQID